MIQRAQTFFMAAIPVIILMMFFVPLASFESVEGMIKLSMSGYTFPTEAIPEQLPPWQILPALGLLLAIMSIAVIFQYKNRVTQLRMNRITLMVNIFFIAAIFYVTDKTNSLAGVIKSAYHASAYLSMVPVFLIYLANGRIRKDEMKVKAADRLR